MAGISTSQKRHQASTPMSLCVAVMMVMTLALVMAEVLEVAVVVMREVIEDGHEHPFDFELY